MSKAVKKEVHRAAKTGGSTLTKIARSTALESFFNVMRNELNLQVKSFETLKTSQVQIYVDHLKKSLTHRTIQNHLAHIRTGLKSVGREHFAGSPQMSNTAFGVSGATRDGTHRALSALEYQNALLSAGKISPGAAAALQLQAELGLRAREAIQSPASLKHWERALLTGQPIQVLHGTKGGRGRWAGPVDPQKALEAVRLAIKVSQKQDGKIIESRTLQGAARAYGRVCESVGLKGEKASHSLRCSYAQSRFAQHLERLGSRREALAATSLDLGHGDGRGTYVDQVYLRNTPD